jgi:hypothetical protein
MLEVKDQALLENDVLDISILPEENEPGHYDVLIEMKNAYVMYNTLTQCIFLIYKAMYEGDTRTDLVMELRYGKGLAFDSDNNYRGFTFVIQPSVFTRMRNDLLTSLVSCAVRHYDQEVGLPEEFKKHAGEFPFVDLLEEQALVVTEPTNHDVVFAAPRFTR